MSLIEFLLFYFLFAVLLSIAAFWVLKASDRTDVSVLPPVPSEPDPIEIAYLAGGENNVIRTVLYDLIQRGWVELDADRRIRPVQRSARPGELTTMEQHILDVARSSPKATNLFENALLRSVVRNECVPLRERLDSLQLLLPQSVTQMARRVSRIGLSVLAGLALTKALLDELQGKSSIGFLVAPTVVAIACLLVVMHCATSPIPSRRGRAFLLRLRRAYSDLKTRSIVRYSQTRGEPSRSVDALKGPALFMIGLYGFGMLQGTPDAHIEKAFERGSDGGAAACGGGGCCGGCGGGCGGGG